jgi:hypothetical protein
MSRIAPKTAPTIAPTTAPKKGELEWRDFWNYLRIFLQQDVRQLSFGEGLPLQGCIEGHV